MPIYEFRCRECGTKTTFLTLSVKSGLGAKCRNCGSRKLVKLVSRVAVLKSEEGRLESLADPSKLAGVDENDPRSLARWMKRMGKEMGDEVGEDFDQSVDKAVEQAEEGEETDGGEEDL